VCVFFCGGGGQGTAFARIARLLICGISICSCRKSRKMYLMVFLLLQVRGYFSIHSVKGFTQSTSINLVHSFKGQHRNIKINLQCVKHNIYCL
jgi:hypothetical protein